MLMCEVTEQDFRMKEFIGAKPEDYEFRQDGKIVRKDRWEMGMRVIASLLFPGDYEIDEVIQKVRNLVREE